MSAPARHDGGPFVDSLSETHRAIRCMVFMVEGGLTAPPLSITSDAIDLRGETVTVSITVLT